MDRRDLLDVFRARLAECMARGGLTQAALARRVGLDRSTLAQFLGPGNKRLPRADTLAAIALDRQVSVDWLLGLAQEGALGAALLPQPLEIEKGGHVPSDERIERWFAEAVGYKVRYVPTTLPDLLKTDEVIRYEFRDYAPAVPRTRIAVASERLETQRRPESDLEVCSARQGVEIFAHGEGIWRELDLEPRRRQIEHMMELVTELYPTFRWFLFDGRRRYAAPMTIFGPKRAALYVGDLYLVLNSTEHIRALAARFDDLIRSAVVQPSDVVKWLGGLLREMGSRRRRVKRRNGMAHDGE
ncbi:MAG TPA: helix-turn-helix domain-containing protein [Dongiaceae bacterium]|nr:helix-turn-helix domain-containing protein [Dongiaceae bacterium]